MDEELKKIMMKIQGKPFNIAIVQVYAPTSASTDDKIEEFYNLLESTLDQVKSNEVLVVIRRFECKCRTRKKWKHCGPMWYGREE